VSNDDPTRSLRDYTGLIRRRGRIAALVMPAVLLAGFLVAFLLPATYRATGALMAEGATVTSDLVRSARSLEDRDLVRDSTERIELLRRRVMNKSSLADLVQKVDPYPKRKDLTAQDKARLIAENTSLEPINPVTFKRAVGTAAFALHYQNPDPAVAASVGTALLNLYVAYNSRVRTEQAADATQFLQQQASLLEADMLVVERKLAEFKSRYGDALPTSEGRNMMGADRSRRDLEDVQRRILAAEEKEGLLRVQIGEISPSLASAVGNWRTELSKLKGELALAEQKYTPDHPDVKRLRRAISELSEKGALSDTGESRRADNPEYLRVSSQLDSARRELASLRSSEARIRGELYAYEQNLATAPNVEREYIQLSRQYEGSQAQYNELQQKIKAASLTESLEAQSKGERFAIISEVSVPSQPYSPNRIGILLIALLLGIGISVLWAVVADSTDPTVRNARDIEGVFGSDPIATIPVLRSHADIQSQRRVLGSTIAAYAAAAAVSVVAVLFFR
jgi:polysaccharide chain length determinant protein (PEP-CTERM system associated)